MPPGVAASRSTRGGSRLGTAIAALALTTTDSGRGRPANCAERPTEERAGSWPPAQSTPQRTPGRCGPHRGGRAPTTASCCPGLPQGSLPWHRRAAGSRPWAGASALIDAALAVGFAGHPKEQLDLASVQATAQATLARKG